MSGHARATVTSHQVTALWLPARATFVARDGLAVWSGRGQQVDEQGQRHTGGEKPEGERREVVAVAVAVHVS